MAHELSRVPQFNILQIESGEAGNCIGVFDSSLDLGDGWIGYLVDQNGLCIEGRWFNYDALTRQSTFKPKDTNQTTQLAVNKTYAYLDGYWGERVALVFDAGKHWRRELFKAEDAIEYRSGATRVRGKVGQTPSFPVNGEAKMMPGGWDHEHCAICWQTIADYAQPFGYTEEQGEWVCEKCYSDHVQPKDVSFLDDQAISQIRGA